MRRARGRSRTRCRGEESFRFALLKSDRSVLHHSNDSPLLGVGLADLVKSKGGDGADEGEDGNAGGTTDGEVTPVVDLLVSARRGHVPGG